VPTLVPALLLAACSSSSAGGGSPPLIGATVVSFASGAGSGGSVEVVSADTGAAITTAAVTINGATLPFSPPDQAYVGDVVVAPGATVTVRVEVGGRAYGATATQVTSYPAITAPAPDATWAAYDAHDVAWSAGGPTTGASYAIGVIDVDSPTGALVWPPDGFLRALPTSGATAQVPADALSVGSRVLVVGLVREAPFPGAGAGSFIAVGGFDGVPVAVMDDSGRRWGGSGWPGVGIPPFTTLRAVTWSGTQYLAAGTVDVVGSTSCQVYGGIFTSPDGVTWTPRASCGDFPSYLLTGAAWSGSSFAVVGGSALLTSPDGVTWTTHPEGAGRSLHRVAWTGVGFVAVGDAGAILVSPDGSAWTAAASGTSDDLRGVAWSGTRLVAVGIGGTVLVSSDGASWAPATSGTGPPLQDVAWSSGGFVALGVGGALLTSPEGLAWATGSTGGSDSLLGLATSGGRVLAVGGRGAVAASGPGGAWSVGTTGSPYDLWAATWNGTRYLAVGELGGVMTSP
jgi:hypothetical protein